MSLKDSAQKKYKKLLIDNPQDQSVISEIPIEILGMILIKLPHQTFKQIVTRTSRQTLANAVAFLQSDKAAHFIRQINNIDPDLKNDIFSLLKPEQQAQIEKLLKYSTEEVGAYMQLEILTATPKETIDDVKEKIKIFETENSNLTFIELFITTLKNHLINTIQLSDLLFYENHETIQSIINNTAHAVKPFSINEHAPINKVVRLFEEFDLSTIAVVDNKGKLLGRILFDDIYAFIRSEEEKQALTMSGTHLQAEENFATAQRTRLEWIFINLVAILLAAMVVNHFKGSIEQIVALAVLMPVVAALGGNVGNQAVTVTVRRLALGEINYTTALMIISKEVRIGIVNGLIIGLVVGILAYFWFHQPMLGVVVGLAIMINLSMAGLIGSALPIIFKHFRIDPAIASPLLLTTATDAMGFFIFLGLATYMLL